MMIDQAKSESSLSKVDSPQPLNSGRPKREAKKQLNEDMIYQFSGIEQFNATVTPKNYKLSGQGLGLMNLRHMRVSDNHDPFVVMSKHIIDPLIAADKLEVLRQHKIEFEVLLYPKDLKALTKKDEMVKQRVHLEKSPE